ncbi:DEAD/DEAH box helicase [Thermonema rossianum]|uniref:DEAD/DEAH box helicase n=1 Tax=Thermonema rossianum TaxID=55505 RepID=UPI00056E8F3E|nr:AAA domain-containing protein [Thermonema rossianum]
MISPIDAQYFYNSCHEGIQSTHSALQKLWHCKTINEELAVTICRNIEKQRFFYHFYDRLNFILEACQLPAHWHEYFNRLKYLFLKAESGQNIHENDWKDALLIVTQLIEHCSNTPPPPVLQDLLAGHTLSARLPGAQVQRLNKLRLLLNKRPEIHNNTFCKLEGLSPEAGEISILVKDIPYSSPDGSRHYTFKLTETVKYLQANQVVHLTNLIHTPTGWQTTDETLLIVDPDYLIDVSSIVQCYYRHRPLPLLALISRFLTQEASFPAFLGNLTNELFDLMISKPEIDEKTAIRQVVDSKQTERILLQMQTEETITEERISFELQRYFKNIKSILPHYTSGQWHTLTEPHFYAPFYGLQGRIDLLLIDRTHTHHQNIVELKSGKPPAYHIWDNHLLQVSAYNLLLEDATPQRRGNSAVFYARMAQDGLRDCGNLLYEKQLLLQIRNHIVFYERLLCRMTAATMTRILKQLNENTLPPFLQSPVRAFAHAWQEASELDRAYVAAHSAFLGRELRTAKMGSYASNRTHKGFAALWREPAESKAEDFGLATHLTVSQWDLASSRLYLKRPAGNHTTVAFREGDIVLLYPEQYKNNPTGHPILRGMLDQVDSERFVVKLRNRFVDPAIFKQHRSWCMENDWIETTFTPLFQSLGTFLKADARKKALIYGQERPRFGPLPHLNERFDGLTPTQKKELQRALSAQDYYLLQGPPGTGKTSALLRKMAEYLYHHTQENIALIAFTNRATDEIALKLHQAHIPFVRLGMGSGEEELLPYRLQQKEEDARALQSRLRQCRVWVSTVSSFSRYLPLCGNIDTLIVDEASQLLETHLCGLLAQCKRFILIGDERQLPAVVMQDVEGNQNFENQSSLYEDVNLLKTHGLYPLHLSLFERLLYHAQNKGWTEAYGMLKEHFRCHEDIMQAFNALFYKELRAATEHQKAPLPATGHPVFDGGRLVFIATRPEEQLKVHEQEADLVVRLIEDYLRLHPDCPAEAIGVIAPFRAQIAHIKSKLPRELAARITIDTVERFQGSERRLIIMSAAVNHPRHLQAIEAPDIHGTVDRKLNVAISRAQEQFVLLGVAEVLGQSVFYKQLIENFCQRIPAETLSLSNTKKA